MYSYGPFRNMLSTEVIAKAGISWQSLTHYYDAEPLPQPGKQEESWRIQVLFTFKAVPVSFSGCSFFFVPLQLVHGVINF